MAVDERSRHALFTRLEEVLGREHAAVLIEHLPPVGWADVATKHDLAQLQSHMDAKLEAFDVKFEIKLEALEHKLLAGFRAEMNSQARAIIIGMVTSLVGVAGVAVAAARLIQ